jgi:hypothetical protein
MELENDIAATRLGCRIDEQVKLAERAHRPVDAYLRLGDLFVIPPLERPARTTSLFCREIRMRRSTLGPPGTCSAILRSAAFESRPANEYPVIEHS